MLTQSLPGHAVILATWYEAWAPKAQVSDSRNLKAETRSGLNSAHGLGCWNLHPNGLPGQLPQTCCLIYQYLSFLICEVGTTAACFTGLGEHCMSSTNLYQAFKVGAQHMVSVGHTLAVLTLINPLCTWAEKSFCVFMSQGLFDRSATTLWAPPSIPIKSS